jgi:hypothetical protein
MTTMTKIDLKKTMRAYYNPSSKDFSVIEVPPMNFLMIDGTGDPGGEEFANAMQALYSVSYPLKFMAKRELGIDCGVAPLEALWDAPDVEHIFDRDVNKGEWLWTTMIMQPGHITREMVERAMAEAGKKKDLPALSATFAGLRFETLHEGLSVQILHIGSYVDEWPTLKRLHQEYIPQQGLVEAGKHHEIYIGDPNRSAPDKLRTVLRQPVRVKV